MSVRPISLVSMHPSFEIRPDIALTTMTGISGMAQGGSRISNGSFFS